MPFTPPQKVSVKCPEIRSQTQHSTYWSRVRAMITAIPCQIEKCPYAFLSRCLGGRTSTTLPSRQIATFSPAFLCASSAFATPSLIPKSIRLERSWLDFGFIGLTQQSCATLSLDATGSFRPEFCGPPVWCSFLNYHTRTMCLPKARRDLGNC